MLFTRIKILGGGSFNPQIVIPSNSVNRNHMPAIPVAGGNVPGQLAGPAMGGGRLAGRDSCDG